MSKKERRRTLIEKIINKIYESEPRQENPLQQKKRLEKLHNLLKTGDEYVVEPEPIQMITRPVEDEPEPIQISPVEDNIFSEKLPSREIERPLNESAVELSEIDEKPAYFVIFSHGEIFLNTTNDDLRVESTNNNLKITRKRISSCGAKTWCDSSNIGSLLELLYAKNDEESLKHQMFSPLTDPNRYLNQNMYAYHATKNYARRDDTDKLEQFLITKTKKINTEMNEEICDIHNMCYNADKFREKIFEFKDDPNICTPELHFGIYMLRDLTFTSKKQGKITISKGSNLLENEIFLNFINKNQHQRELFERNNQILLKYILFFFTKCEVTHVYYIDLACNVIRDTKEKSDEFMTNLLIKAKKENQTAGFRRKNKSRKNKSKKNKSKKNKSRKNKSRKNKRHI